MAGLSRSPISATSRPITARPARQISSTFHRAARLSFTNGLGGSSIRDYNASLHDDDTWWATKYCSNLFVKNEQVQAGSAKHGALFLVFNVDGDPSKARGYFKNISGEVIDEFTIIRN
jgi:hypothetical protein